MFILIRFFPCPSYVLEPPPQTAWPAKRVTKTILSYEPLRTKHWFSVIKLHEREHVENFVPLYGDAFQSRKLLEQKPVT